MKASTEGAIAIHIGDRALSVSCISTEGSARKVRGVMHSAQRPFTIKETHGPLRQPGAQIQAASDSRGWTSLYLSLQRESPFEGRFDAVDDQLIVLHLDGPVMVHRHTARGEDSRSIPSGGMFMVPGGMDYGVRLGAALQTLHLYLRRALIEEVAAEVARGDPAHLETVPLFGDADPLIEGLMLGIRGALYEDDPTVTPYVDYLARAIAARLVQHHSRSLSPLRNRAIAGASLTKSRHDKAVDFIEANLSHSIGLPQIAHAAGLSPSHFARQFRATVGRAPHQYLIERRVDRAKSRLGKTNASIAEIAFECGFANQEHLTRLFKRVCGITPAAYRKARRG